MNSKPKGFCFVLFFLCDFYESIRCDKLYGNWNFYVMGYDRTGVHHPNLWQTDKCLHSQMITTAGNWCLVHRKGSFASTVWEIWVKTGGEGVPRDPSYVCSCRHMGACCCESFFHNSSNTRATWRHLNITFCFFFLSHLFLNFLV